MTGIYSYTSMCQAYMYPMEMDNIPMKKPRAVLDLVFCASQNCVDFGERGAATVAILRLKVHMLHINLSFPRPAVSDSHH